MTPPANAMKEDAIISMINIIDANGRITKSAWPIYVWDNGCGQAGIKNQNFTSSVFFIKMALPQATVNSLSPVNWSVVYLVPTFSDSPGSFCIDQTKFEPFSPFNLNSVCQNNASL